ncbi:hypothetical protein YC2023_081127 [Brassica napus]
MRKVLGEFTNNKIFQYVHKHHTQKISNAYSIYVYKYTTHMIITNNCTKRGHVPIPKHEVPGEYTITSTYTIHKLIINSYMYKDLHDVLVNAILRLITFEKYKIILQNNTKNGITHI